MVSQVSLAAGSPAAGASATAGRASPGATAAPTRLLLPNPNRNAALQRSRRHVNSLREAGRRSNTKKVCDPKLQELRELCMHEHSTEDAPCQVANDKVWWFMLCQAFRKPKQRGGKKKSPPPKFNVEECDEIVKPFKLTTASLSHPIPTEPVGCECFDQCKKATRKLHGEQPAEKSNSIGWEFIWDDNLAGLLKHVKERKAAIDRANCKEKQTQEMAPCVVVNHCGTIEKLLWDDAAAAPSARSLCGRLRHRCCCLTLTSSALRSESLHRAETSDFFGPMPPMKFNDVHPVHLSIDQIAAGETTNGCNQWGRAARHKDVVLCSVGATSLCLECGESQLREFMSVTKEQWKDNSAWHDIKFLADVNGSDTKVEMNSDTHGDKIKAMLESLGLPTNKVSHLGRNIGAKWLDCVEVDAEEVKRMGQWNQSVHEKHCSSKPPMLAIRTLAGFTEGSGMHFNARTQVMPPVEPQRMTHLGCTSADMLDQFAPEEASQHPTAFGVLQWFGDLSMCFLQDLAAMMNLHPHRSCETMERELPVLRTKEFKEHAAVMREALLNEESPLDASMEKVLPGVHKQFQTAQADRNRQHSECMEAIRQLGVHMQTGFSNISQCNWNNSSRIVGAALMETGADAPARASGGSSDEGSPISPENTEDGVTDDDIEAVMNFTGANEQATPTPPTIQTTTLNNPPDLPPADRGPTLFRLMAKHSSLLSLWNEWFGLDEWEDNFGGVAGRNTRHPGWRKKAKIDGAQCGRHRRLVEAIGKQAKAENSQPEETIAQWEVMFESVNFVTGNLVKALQRLGKIPTKGSRGKTKKATNNNNNETNTNDNNEQQQEGSRHNCAKSPPFQGGAGSHWWLDFQ